VDLTSARREVDEGTLAVSSVILIPPSREKDLSKVVASRIIICVTVLLCEVAPFARNDTLTLFARVRSIQSRSLRARR
jgi:hypothetical protein